MFAPFCPALRYLSPPRPSSRLIVLWGGAFFSSHRFRPSHPPAVSSSHRLISSRPAVSNIAGRGASRLVPRLGLVPSSFRMKQGDGVRRPISSCPCGGYLVAPSHLIPSRSSSWSLVSSDVSPCVIPCHLISEGQASNTARASRLGLSVPSSHPCGGRVVIRSSFRHRLISSPSASKQAAGITRRHRSVGWDLVLSFRRSAMIPGGIVLSSFPRRSPVRAPSPHPSPYRKNPASKQAMGMADRFRRSYHGGKRRTSKQDENSGRPRPIHIIQRSHDDHTGFISYRHQHNRPAPRQAQRDDGRDAGARERDGERQGDKTSTGTTETSTRDDEHGNTRPRKTISKQQDAQRDDKRDARQQDGGRDETQAVRAKASGKSKSKQGDEDRRTGRIEQPIL